MRPSHDPASLTPEQRFRELAAVLAAGLRRLREPRTPAAGPGTHPAPEKPSESGANCLEVPGETVLSVHTG